MNERTINPDRPGDLALGVGKTVYPAWASDLGQSASAALWRKQQEALKAEQRRADANEYRAVVAERDAQAAQERAKRAQQGQVYAERQLRERQDLEAERQQRLRPFLTHTGRLVFVLIVAATLSTVFAALGWSALRWAALGLDVICGLWLAVLYHQLVTYAVKPLTPRKEPSWS